MWGARRGLLAIAVVLPALAAGAVWALWQRCGLRGCPDVRVLEELAHDRGAIVLDRRGREVARLHRSERVIIPLDSLPPYVPAAFIAVDDRRFWTHGGIDLQRTAGAGSCGATTVSSASSSRSTRCRPPCLLRSPRSRTAASELTAASSGGTSAARHSPTSARGRSVRASARSPCRSRATSSPSPS